MSGFQWWIHAETNCNRHHRFNEICVGFCYLCNALSATFFNPANDAIRLYNTCWVLVLFLLAEAKIDWQYRRRFLYDKQFCNYLLHSVFHNNVLNISQHLHASCFCFVFTAIFSFFFLLQTTQQVYKFLCTSKITTFVRLLWCSSVQTKLILKLLPESIQIPSNSFNASSYKKYFPADVCSRIFEN